MTSEALQGALSLFDGEGARDAIQARDEAIARVQENAPPDWMQEARRTVLAIAETRSSFTTDDVWAALEGAPPEPRALGAVMKGLSREGKIRATSAWRQSVRAECHARPVRVWEKGARG